MYTFVPALCEKRTAPREKRSSEALLLFATYAIVTLCPEVLIEFRNNHATVRYCLPVRSPRFPFFPRFRPLPHPPILPSPTFFLTDPAIPFDSPRFTSSRSVVNTKTKDSTPAGRAGTRTFDTSRHVAGFRCRVTHYDPSRRAPLPSGTWNGIRARARLFPIVSLNPDIPRLFVSETVYETLWSECSVS